MIRACPIVARPPVVMFTASGQLARTPFSSLFDQSSLLPERFRELDLTRVIADWFRRRAFFGLCWPSEPSTLRTRINTNTHADSEPFRQLANAQRRATSIHPLDPKSARQGSRSRAECRP